MFHKIGSNLSQSLLRTDQPLNRRPLRLLLFLFRQPVIFEQGLDLGVDLRLLILVQIDPGKTALVVNRNGRPIFHRTADIVDVDIFAKDGRCIHIRRFDRRSCKAHEGGVRQRLTNIMGIAIATFAGLPV